MKILRVSAPAAKKADPMKKIWTTRMDKNGWRYVQR